MHEVSPRRFQPAGLRSRVVLGSDENNPTRGSNRDNSLYAFGDG